MIEKIYRKPTNRIIALLLVLTMIFVYIIGNNVGGLVVLERYKNSMVNNISNLGMNYIDQDRELKLAVTETELGKASESLQDGYTALAASYDNEDDFNAAVNDFSMLVTSLKESAVAELDKTDNGSAEYNDYRSSVLSNFDELETYINELNADNAEAVLGKIEEKVAAEKPYISHAGELPFGEVSSDSILYAAYTETASADYQPENTNYSQSNLEITNDIILNDKIRSEFEELDSVLDIYQFVKNNYMTEFYYGSRKGAIGTYEQKSGNDYDQASLLIGLLRDRGIPARYVRGEIEITAEQAMSWTATDDINVALRIISSLGVPVTGLTSGSDIVAVRVEHVWVEAYVPYTDYRGAGNQSGESLWIPLDPSFKDVFYHDGVDLLALEEYMNDEANFLTADSEIYGVNVGEIASFVEGENSAIVKYIIENGYGQDTKEEVFGGREIVQEYLGYLPLTLPYSVSKTIDAFDDIPLNLTDSIAFSLLGNSAFDLNFNGTESINEKLYTPDIYGKRIVLAYAPATDADADILARYGDLFKTPAYLLKLKPQLLIDGQVIAEGSACNAGYMQKYTITTHNGSPHTNDGIVANSITVGGIYCIALDYGTISADSLQNSADNMEVLKETISETNIYTDAAMGEMLNSIGKAYFSQLDMYNLVVAGQSNVTSMRDLSVGIVGFNINVVYTFDRPAELNEGGIFLDIGRDVHSVISNENSKKNEKSYMLQTGMHASAMEHEVLEQMTGIESVSTIKTFEYAVENNIPIHTITKENLSDELAILNVSDQIKQEIRSSVNSGKLVIIPEEEITINQWSGIGYMVLDTETFACGYMISGGMAGGAMTWNEVIGEYVGYVFLGLLTGILLQLVASVIVTGWVGVLFFAFKCIMMITWIVQLVELYMLWEETGEPIYLQELLIQLAAGATVYAIFMGTDLRAKIQEFIDWSNAHPIGGGACFVAGTLVATPSGSISIEDIETNDMVLSFDPSTQIVSENMVEEAFIRDSAEIVKVKVNNETITTTPEHPFYVAQKGFTNAIELRAGDILWTVNGEYVVVEQIQHEILESPVTVYNFRVSNNHTYFVGNNGVGVHNTGCTPSSGNNVKFGSDSKSADKLARQMEQRGWTEQSVRDTVNNPTHTSPAMNKATGNNATAYFNADGSYVVVDNVSLEIVQVSAIGDANWIPDPSIVDPYIPDN